MPASPCSFKAVAALLIVALLCGCASPQKELWPPKAGSTAYPVTVSVDSWHAMIAFPVERFVGSWLTIKAYEEWGYAERAWYLEGRTGLTGIVRAFSGPRKEWWK